MALFEQKVPMGENRDGYIDCLWKGVILIEMKSKGKSLTKAFDQAKDYAFNLEDDELPEYIMVCDFENINLYRFPTKQNELNENQRWLFKTENLVNHVKKFALLAGYKIDTNTYAPDIPVNEKAAKKMAKLHDKLKENGYDGHALEVYLIRLLYCMFADDSFIFEKGAFYEYIKSSKEDGSDLSEKIANLFRILDMNDEERTKNKLLSDEMKKKFKYINGKLFEEVLSFADFDGSMRQLILDCCNMDWSKISPAIFGAMFQEVTDQNKRRELGAHYTSEENILKLIKPLFLDDLRKEFELIKHDKYKLSVFHDKLASLKFLDPACGCGNFLIVAYRELRLLELEVLDMLIDDRNQISLDVVEHYCKVNVNQFYGIELSNFPCQIAHVGMWLIDHQMNGLVSEHFGLYYARLPLKASATIVNKNALRIDWNEVVPKAELNYIMGNPPFVGAMNLNCSQREDMKLVLANEFRKFGEMDYVTAWYKKASDYMRDTQVESAFVSTNSISQGQQPSILWNPLMNKNDTVITFAYKTFKWSNESTSKKAAVHCVIIGFSNYRNNKEKKLFNSKNDFDIVKNINPYLIDADNILVVNRNNPICDVPKMKFGSMPRDGGNFSLNDEEKSEIIKSNPIAKKWIKRFVGAEEFLNQKSRWCLWLTDAKPNELRKCSKVMERIQNVKRFRLSSKAEATRKFANTPTLFCQIAQPNENYILVPRVSSENRKYVPIGFMSKNIIASDATLIIPDATLYHFGILTSSVHMAWMRAVAGRLEMRYRYSKDIVYNNFIWPNPTEKQKEKIEKLAQGVLDARKLYPDSTLADLYDPNTMPRELVTAHNKLDDAVKEAYGSKGFETEEETVASLMKLYKDAIDNE